MSEDSQDLAATNAAETQKKQEDQPEIPAWVPGDLPDDKKKPFVEAVKKAWESDNSQFDFDGRTYKITEKELVGNQDKLDVNGNGKIDGDDLATLRGEKPVKEDHMENETETPGQTEYPGSDMKDTNGNGQIDGEDKAEVNDDEEDSDEGLDEGTIAKKRSDMMRVTHGAMSMADYRAKWKGIGKKKPENDALSGMISAYKNKPKPAVKEATNTPDEASKKAHGLTSSAKSKSEHMAAADAHDAAADAHKAAGNTEKEKEHDKLAKHHYGTAYTMGGKDKSNFGWQDESVSEATEQNPTDKLTLDVPAMIRSLEKSREDFKSDEEIHNFVQDLLKKKDATIDTNALPKNESVNAAAVGNKRGSGGYPPAVHIAHAASEKAWDLTDHAQATGSKADHAAAHEAHLAAVKAHNSANRKLTAQHHSDQAERHRAAAGHAVTEKLDPKADAGEWISDFVHSKDPKFDGKSPEKRKEMALAAYYSARREAGLSEEVMTEASAAELSKHAHAVSSTAKSAADHRVAANAHYKAAEALRRHTTANAGKTGKKADDAHTAALKHEKLGDKHVEKYSTMKESTEQLNENIAADPHAAHLSQKANQASALAHSTPNEAGSSAHHQDAMHAHQNAAEHYRIYYHHAGDPILRHVAGIHHTFHSDMAQHHMLRHLEQDPDLQASAVKEGTESLNEDVSKIAHTASDTAKKSNTSGDHIKAMQAHNDAQRYHAKMYHSAAQKKNQAAKELHAKAYHDHKHAADMHHDTAQFIAVTKTLPKDSVKEGTSADAKGGPEVMDAATKKMKDEADKNVKAEEAPYTNKADGSENVTPADKPKANPSPMPTLTKEQALRSVADTYAAMVK